MNELTAFIHWANRISSRRGLICHFYISESTKQYYSSTDYAFFNLFSDSKNWMVKGTTEHGVISKRGKTSPIPCLNCFEVNDKFYEALKQLSDKGNTRFELGIIFNKRKLKTHYGRNKIIDVTPIAKPPDPFPSPRECHRYDWICSRRKLWPFHQCDVVRLEIPETDFGLPITAIPCQAIMGMLIRRKEHHGIVNLLQELKKWDMKRIGVFPLL